MITITIGEEQRSLEDAEESWIVEQITRRRQETTSASAFTSRISTLT